MADLDIGYWKQVFDFKGLAEPADEKAREANRRIITDRLVSHGFSKDLAYLLEFDVSVRLMENEFYLKSEAQSPLRAVRNIAAAAGRKVKIMEATREAAVMGSYTPVIMEAYGEEYRMNVLFMKRFCEDGSSYLLSWGHEDGHFLYQTGRREIILSRVNSPQLTYELKDQEDFCVFCGYFALHHFTKTHTKKSRLETLSLRKSQVARNPRNEAERKLIEEEIKRGERDRRILDIAKQCLLQIH